MLSRDVELLAFCQEHPPYLIHHSGLISHPYPILKVIPARANAILFLDHVGRGAGSTGQDVQLS